MGELWFPIFYLYIITMIDTIVLDLDGTLVSTVSRPVKVNTKKLVPRQFEDLYVYRRPYVDLFIKHILQRYRHIYVWSDSELSYIRFVMLILFGKNIGRVEHIFTRADCDASERIYGIKKDMKYVKAKTGTLIKNMIILEDRPVNVKNTHNRIFINPVDFEDKSFSVDTFLRDTTLKRLIDEKYI